MLLAVPVAVSCVEETTVVVRAVLPRKAMAPAAKCRPVNDRVNGPTGMTRGDTLLSCGIGLFNVTALLPVFEVSTVSVALTVMVLGAGGNSGAV